jgi:hypothetical protein
VISPMVVKAAGEAKRARWMRIPVVVTAFDM